MVKTTSAASTPQVSMLTRWLPALVWLRAYQKEWLRFDVIAGLTTASVIIPKAMAYAAIAGLPLVVGLYTSLIPLIVYAVMGTSRPLSVTTSATLALMAGAALGEAAPGGEASAMLAAAATLSLLVGIFLVLAGVFRLGVVANLISEPVLTGFKCGVGLIVVLDQLPKVLGIHIAKAGFLWDTWAILEHLPETSLPTLVLALGMLGLMLGLEHFTPKAPAALVTVAVGIGVSAMFGLTAMGISLVGPIQAGLPSLALPELGLAQQLWPAALGIALMSFVETAAAGRSFLHKGEVAPIADSELVATGMANVVGSLFHIMPAGGGTSQTAVNNAAGARTQLAALVTAVVVVATLLFLAPLFALMPHATLAVVVIVASIGLCNPAGFRAILRIRSMEFCWALAAVVGVTLLGTLRGVLVAVVVSLVALILQGNRYPVAVLGRKRGSNVFRPRSAEHGDDEQFPGLLLVRPEGVIYFANVARLAQKVRELCLEFSPKVLALDMRAVPDLEFTALKFLGEAEEKLRGEGITLWLVALNPDVLAVIQRSGLGERLGRDRMFFKLEQAVEHFQALE